MSVLFLCTSFLRKQRYTGKKRQLRAVKNQVAMKGALKGSVGDMADTDDPLIQRRVLLVDWTPGDLYAHFSKCVTPTQVEHITSVRKKPKVVRRARAEHHRLFVSSGSG